MTAQGVASRKIAVELLLQVLQQDKTVEEAIGAAAGYGALNPQDRSFCHHLVMTVLRHRGALDALLKNYMQKPLKRSRMDVQCCLYAGACQLLLMEVPAHAAVDTSVELVKRHAPGLAGLANAVLKRVNREGAAWWQKQSLGQLNTPDWLWQSWVKAYGRDQAMQIAAAHQKEPGLDINLKNPQEADRWQQALGLQSLPMGGWRVTGSHRHIAEWEGFAEGAWWVQELAASLPVRLMGDVRGMRVLDCCAAPGGKTAQLAAAGAEVLAVDQSAARMERLQENMQRLGLVVETQVADLLKWQPSQPFDAILLDAPCSATGTIRRHPELPWLRQPQDIARLTDIQARLLDRALGWLRPEGMLIYAVCSLQPEEGERHVDRLLAEKKAALAPVTERELDGQAQWLRDRGDIRTLPCHLAGQGGMDGFYIARLRPVA